MRARRLSSQPQPALCCALPGFLLRSALRHSLVALTAPSVRRPVVLPPPKPVTWWVYALYALLTLAVLFVLFAPRSLVERLPLPLPLIELLTGDSFWPGVPGGRGWSTAHAPPLYRALSRWFN